jgi:hypothetical protein
VLPQVWTPLPEHWVEPGAHEPVHWPLLQRVLAHALVAPKLPVAVQVWTPPETHWVAPGVQVP